MRRSVVIVLALLALPVVWFAYRWYDLSVRWGTSDPCEVIAERLTDEMMKFVDPAGLDRLLNLQRPSQLGRETRRVREHGALACWLSVLFGVPTQTEISHASIMSASHIRRSWDRWKQEGDETSRTFAVVGAEIAEVDVLEHLLSMDVGDAVEILKAVLAEDPGERADIEAAVKQRCWLGIRESGQDCVARHFALLGLPRTLPTESERANAVGRDYVAAGLASEFAVEAETLRLTTTRYPEALARNVCSKLPAGWQVVVYHPDRERPVAQCGGRFPKGRTDR